MRINEKFDLSYTQERQVNDALGAIRYRSETDEGFSAYECINEYDELVYCLTDGLYCTSFYDTFAELIEACEAARNGFIDRFYC